MGFTGVLRPAGSHSATYHDHGTQSRPYRTNVIAITPITTLIVPSILAQVSPSSWRKKIAPRSAVQIGDVAEIGDTMTTGP
jgi:hypothetical protein